MFAMNYPMCIAFQLSNDNMHSWRCEWRIFHEFIMHVIIIIIAIDNDAASKDRCNFVILHSSSDIVVSENNI